MRRISDSEVELNDLEKWASDHFEYELDMGWNIDKAVQRTKTAFSDAVSLSDEFYIYLSGG